MRKLAPITFALTLAFLSQSGAAASSRPVSRCVEIRGMANIKCQFEVGRYSDGSRMVDGKYTGRGAAQLVGGRSYSGDIEGDLPQGKGKMIFPSGAEYVGEFNAGERSGHGVFSTPSGDVYVGEWREDRKEGRGTLTYSNGEKYVGRFRAGLPNGHGIYTWPDGRRFVGNFSDGKLNGEGAYYREDGKLIDETTWNDVEISEIAGKAMPRTPVAGPSPTTNSPTLPGALVAPDGAGFSPSRHSLEEFVAAHRGMTNRMFLELMKANVPAPQPSPANSLYTDQSYSPLSYERSPTPSRGLLLPHSFSGSPNQIYSGMSGANYRYDLSNPGDQVRYSIDVGAQLRDSVDVRVKIDRGLGQYG